MTLRAFTSPIAGTPDAALRQVTRANDNALRDALVLYGIPTITSISTSAAISATRQHVRADASGGAIAPTLPPLASTDAGVVITVKKIDASGNAVTVTASGSDTIDGAATFVLGVRYLSVTLQATATSWDVI